MVDASKSKEKLFWNGGLDGQAWKVNARLDEAPQIPPAPTIHDRVTALEARIGKAGLNA
jgi:hypothetical protein